MPAEWFMETRVKVQSIKHADAQIPGACKIPQIPFTFYGKWTFIKQSLTKKFSH
jgi:hypothetical protein